MLNTNENWRMKIIKSIFAALNLAIIVSGLASCAGNEAPLPLEQKPTLAPIQQPNQPKQQDNDDDKDDDSNDDQDNEDKD
ncbi:hypothetical protein JMG10_36565 [Nostoc ellipsosporum NOK]|nr:hypothetical protein [Nostoc ellipsosporum NOK]BAZ53630.1 hypothetical protein NIES4103_63130 [Nostoc sp. NIES-4103]